MATRSCTSSRCCRRRRVRAGGQGWRGWSYGEAMRVQALTLSLSGAPTDLSSASPTTSILSRLEGRLAALAEESSLRSIVVRRWASREEGVAKLSLSFDTFFSSALLAVRVSHPAARLFTVCGDWRVRTYIDATTYPGFLETSRDARIPVPVVHVFQPVGAETSPQGPDVVESELVTPVKRASTGTRNSVQQSEFRASLVARDGKDVCVACALAGPTEAAHILRHGSPSSLLAPAGLKSAWDVRNGIMLCSVCHLYFDKYMWCVDAGVVAVADALLVDEALKPHFAPLVGRALRHDAGDDDWPREKTWAHHRQLFKAAREARHAMQAENAFVCNDCGSIFKQRSSWAHHVTTRAACDKRLRAGKRRLWTLLDQAAFPGVAAQDDTALGGAVRRLSLVDEGEGAASVVGGEEGGSDAGSSSS